MQREIHVDQRETGQAQSYFWRIVHEDKAIFGELYRKTKHSLENLCLQLNVYSTRAE